MTPALVVGLTGGIASGKSTVETAFLGRGVAVICADAIAREVVEPGQPGLAAVTVQFGQTMLDADGSLNRGTLRQLIFADPSARKTLEGLLHPLIRERMLARLQQVRGAYAMLSIPLLLESGQSDRVDRVLVVDLPEAEQLSRLMRRDGCSRQQAQAILDAQLDRSSRRQAADDIIDNSGPRTGLDSQVETLHHRYLDIARSSPPK